MSYDAHTSDSSRLPIKFDRTRFRYLLTLTVALVAGTIILGVAARTTGSGLACDANWPVCDGGFLNLLPQGQPSFWEWIHRVVAMLAGFAIIASAIAAIWTDHATKAVAGLVTAGLILTPIQVYLGAETVLSYEMTILNFHFWTAILIFVIFVVALVLAWEDRLGARHVAIGLAIGAVTVPVQVLLSPIFIQQNTPTTLTIQMGVLLTLLAVVTLAALYGTEVFDSLATRGTIALGTLLTLGTLILSRESVMTYSPALDLTYLLVAGALFVTLLVGAWLGFRESRPLESGRAAA
ncbi:cytochrome oxidase assembly protein [Halobacteria archaeon AArc-curdl1]|uniref:Cytochrome oxidase assembly protein n=1 Tax=Natronosalvus hydrolyticus TaxID=2979988 RepID=A0AAP2Z8A3_9EURY|nr:cytochrome oxidase assembly protein [Halobacteria archaeon AArc-curdl1]